MDSAPPHHSHTHQHQPQIHQQQLHPHHPASAPGRPEGQIGFDQQPLPPHPSHLRGGVPVSAGPVPGVPGLPLTTSGPAPAHLAVAPHVSDSAAMKLTRGHSCVLCQQRKVRCDKNKPCANCVKAQVECRVVPPQPPRRRKKKPHERELVDRLRKYELLLNQHGVSFEPISLGGVGGGDGSGGRETTLEDLDELQQNLGGLHTSPSSSNVEHNSERSENTSYYTNYRDYRAHNDEDSSDDEVDPGATIHHAFDSMFDHQDGFPFVIGGSMAKVTDAHPSGIQMFQLWQIYLTNVNPLLKITHTHSLQAKIIEAGANPSKIPRPLEALLFSIYFIAITSMPESDVQSTFAEDKSQLLSKYHRATQQALINVGFMRSGDLAVLQAYLLYLICVRQYVDPRALFCLIGIAVRIAQRLGIHRDGAQFGLPPFEVELRRRLWWQLVAFDKRIAEITGATVNALSSSNGDCKWPLNINDTDLHVHAKDAPVQYNGPTEMLFCLTRIEMTTANAPDGMRPSPRQVSTPATTDRARRFHYSPSPSSPDIVTHIAKEAMPDNLDAYSSYIESTYLKACDPKIPLHLFTLLMTRMALCKLHLIEFLVRQSKQQAQQQAQRQQQQNTPNVTSHPSPSTTSTTSGPHSVANQHSSPAQHGAMPPPYAHHPQPNTPHPATTLSSPERDALFLEAVRMIEYDNILQSTPSLRGYAWYTYMHFPLPGYMYLVGEMRARKTGELVERAWDAVCENHELRGLTKNLRSPIHVAFGGHFIKAWDAREQAEARMGKRLETPKFILLMRQLFAKYSPQQKRPAASQQAAGPAVGDRQGDEGLMPGGYTPAGTGGTQQQQIHEQQMMGGGAGQPGEMVMEDTTNFFPSMQYIQQVMMGPQDMEEFGAMDWNSYAPQGGGFDAGGGGGGGGMYGGGGGGPAGGGVYGNMFSGP